MTVDTVVEEVAEVVVVVATPGQIYCNVDAVKPGVAPTLLNMT